MKKIEFMWKNVGKKMINIFCPLWSCMFLKFKGKKLGELGSKIILINLDVEMIKKNKNH